MLLGVILFTAIMNPVGLCRLMNELSESSVCSEGDLRVFNTLGTEYDEPEPLGLSYSDF